MLFPLAMFVGLYSLIYAFSVWQSDLGTLRDLLFYYVAGGIAVTVISVPILYYKAPHKDMMARTTTNRGSAAAIAFVTFCLGSLIGTIIYQWLTGITIIGNISIFIGALITMTGGLMPDWDIPLLGISRHRNIIFHSLMLPLLIVLGTLANVTSRILSSTSLAVGAETEYYITALFLLGYASHLYLDVYDSDANPLEILWTTVDPEHKAPTGLKPLGPIKISQKNARGWLVGNATLLVGIALALFALYFYNILS
jgi:hypothetical protein